MNFREMDIKHSYISKGDNNIADSFLNPILSCAKEYKRSVGFFSSGVFRAINGMDCLSCVSDAITSYFFPHLLMAL